MLTNALILSLNGTKFSTDSVILWFISGIKGVFLWGWDLSAISQRGEVRREGKQSPTQKATLFPSGSALHPTMNGVLKNTTLGTRLFFILHNWAICPGVSSGLLVQSANETAVVVQRCAGVKIPTSQLDTQWSLCGPWGLLRRTYWDKRKTRSGNVSCPESFL